MSDQPKPKTYEWTPKRVEKLLGFNAILGCERIADAHNAELAAARQPKPTTAEWVDTDFYDLGLEEAQEMARNVNAALSAERERFRQMEQMLSRSFDKVQAQLAAEQSAIVEIKRTGKRWREDGTDILEHPAGALAKVKEGNS